MDVGHEGFTLMMELQSLSSTIGGGHTSGGMIEEGLEVMLPKKGKY